MKTTSITPTPPLLVEPNELSLDEMRDGVLITFCRRCLKTTKHKKKRMDKIVRYTGNYKKRSGSSIDANTIACLSCGSEHFFGSEWHTDKERS